MRRIITILASVVWFMGAGILPTFAQQQPESGLGGGAFCLTDCPDPSVPNTAQSSSPPSGPVMVTPESLAQEGRRAIGALTDNIKRSRDTLAARAQDLHQCTGPGGTTSIAPIVDLLRAIHEAQARALQEAANLGRFIRETCDRVSCKDYEEFAENLEKTRQPHFPLPQPSGSSEESDDDDEGEEEDDSGDDDDEGGQAPDPNAVPVKDFARVIVESTARPLWDFDKEFKEVEIGIEIIGFAFPSIEVDALPCKNPIQILVDLREDFDKAVEEIENLIIAHCAPDPLTAEEDCKEFCDKEIDEFCALNTRQTVDAPDGSGQVTPQGGDCLLCGPRGVMVGCRSQIKRPVCAAYIFGLIKESCKIEWGLGGSADIGGN